MSALIKSLKFAKIVNKNPAAVYNAFRAAHWHADYKPGSYPVTEEQRKAAAKRYGMLPEEYKPYPDDGLSCTGDYPHLPDVPLERRDPFYPYDFPELKRNWQEPVHAEHDLYDETRVGTPAPLRYPVWLQYSFFIAVMSGFFGLYFWLEDKKMFPPVMPPQLPAEGVHYTFETK